MTAAGEVQRRRWTAGTELSVQELRTFAELLPYCVPRPLPDGTWLGSRPSVSYAAGASESAHIMALLDEAIRRSRDIRSRSPQVRMDLWELRGSAPSATTADISEVGPGLIVSGTRLARLMRAVDRLALELGIAAGATELAVPHLVSTPTVDQAGYAEAFPQHLTGCCVVRHDLKALDRYAAGSAEERLAELEPADVNLAPAVCLNILASMSGDSLAEGVTCTALGACGRYEATATDSTRLWSFTMREVVYVGNERGALRFREDMLDALECVARDLQLPCRLGSAVDPFFTGARQELAAFQTEFVVKHELLGRMAVDDAPVAISSVNAHGQHFGLGFGIRLKDGSPAHSACVGFGLERWAQWLSSHLPCDEAAWPSTLRDRL